MAKRLQIPPKAATLNAPATQTPTAVAAPNASNDKKMKGRRVRKDGRFSIRAVLDHKKKARAVSRFDLEAMATPAAAVTMPCLRESLREEKGLPMADAALTVAPRDHPPLRASRAKVCAVRA
jgi:hypothetical protein